MLRIALGKGRVIKDTIALLAKAGFDTQALAAESRSLIRPLGTTIEALIVRSQDVPLYVTRGACALGITGLDTLREHTADLLELCDLNIAKCRLCLAGPKNLRLQDNPHRRWRVATKFPHLTTQALSAAGIDHELVVLGGTLETAPESGIADCIVDLVDTGSTLKAHDLIIYQEILPVSAQLVAHKPSFYQQYPAIQAFLTQLQAEIV